MAIFFRKKFRAATLQLSTKNGIGVRRCLRLWLCAIAVIFYPTFVWASATDPYEDLNLGWERFGAVYSRILESYYSNLGHDEIIAAAIYGVLSKLDSYSQFYDEEGLRQLQQETTGRFAGLGITVTIKDNYPMITSPMDRSPAQRAGLLPGDVIVAIEGRDTYGLSLDQVVDALRGEVGSEVSISVAHKVGATSREVVIRREIIKVRSVVLVEEIRPDIGYVSMRHTRFSEDTAAEVEAALKNLRKMGIKGVILDLRGNPGGLLSQATQVVDLFLPKGLPIVSIRERNGCHQETRYSQHKPIARDLPLVVLIDRGSASASEIVAGAVQDNDRGVILGTTSFGKGSVQTVFELPESRSSALKLTTAIYYTPSGRSIHRENAFRPHKSLLKLPIGDLVLPADGLFDLLLGSADLPEAIEQLRVRFDLEKELAEQILSTPLGDLVGGATTGKIRGISAEDSHPRSEEIFYTLRGRKVYGGGGIVPDVQVKSDRPPSYALDLEQRRLLFDFVVDYLPADSVLASSGPVPEVDEAMLEALRDFLSRSALPSRYRNAGRSEIEVLRRTADEMGWSSSVLESIDCLEEAIEQEFTRGFSPKLERYIRAALKREISMRVKGREDHVRTGLNRDLQLEKAIDLLQNLQGYSQVLQGKIDLGM